MEDRAPDVVADPVVTEKERRVINLWRGGGSQLLQFAEAQLVELAESGVPLKLQLYNGYHRMVVYQACWYWGFEVRSKFVRRQPIWRDYGPVASVRDVFVSKPLGWTKPRLTITELWNEERRRKRGRHMAMAVGSTLKESEMAEIAPLREGDETLMSRHAIPRNVLAYIFALVGDLTSVGACARVCRFWNAAAQSPTLWRLTLEQIFVRVPDARAWWKAEEARGVALSVAALQGACKEWLVEQRAQRAQECVLHRPASVPHIIWAHWHGVRAPPDAKLHELSRSPKELKGAPKK